MATFTWLPDYQPTVEIEPRVKTSRFGDGYEQRVEDGINTQPKAWHLTFGVRSRAEAVAIRAFLRAHASTSFDWADPDGETLRYVCRSHSHQINGHNNEIISAVFRQVFGES